MHVKKKQKFNRVLGLSFILVVIMLFFSLYGCAQTSRTLTASEILEIAKTDKDYHDVEKRMPNFDPEVLNYEPLTKNNYESQKLAWKDDKSKNSLIQYIDKLALNKNTVMVELKDKSTSDGFIAIIDTVKKQSLFIVIKLHKEISM